MRKLLYFLSVPFLMIFAASSLATHFEVVNRSDQLIKLVPHSRDCTENDGSAWQTYLLAPGGGIMYGYFGLNLQFFTHCAWSEKAHVEYKVYRLGDPKIGYVNIGTIWVWEHRSVSNPSIAPIKHTYGIDNHISSDLLHVKVQGDKNKSDGHLLIISNKPGPAPSPCGPGTGSHCR